MTAPADEPKLTEAPAERLGADPGKLAQIKPRHMLVRFAFGAATSIAAGLVTIVFSPRAGGILLAFPAILAASLTLIADEEGAADAREDARGALVGAVALTAFAAVGALLFTHLAGGVVIALATVTWLCVAVGGYLLLWRPR